MTVSEKENVLRALRRAALLYRHFAETLEAELGVERAREVIAKAMYAYGGQVGREARARTEAAGLPLTPGNFSDDLPTVGWQTRLEEYNGEQVSNIHVCPFADEWKKGMDPALAKLYCLIDPAKMEAYNPDYTCVHVTHQLDGADGCRLAVRKKER